MIRCNLCLSSDLVLFLETSLKIVNENTIHFLDKKDKLLKCKNCGAIFLADFIMPHLNAEYKSDYYIKDFKREEHVLYLNELRLRKIKFLIDKNKSVLDFGCGKGYVLHLLDGKVKNIFGLELNEAAILNLRKENFTIYSTLEETDHKFDLITIYHVLEHMDQPKDFLNYIKFFLNENGKIVIEVPNVNGYGFKKNKDKWFYLQKEHLYYFNENSLAKLFLSLNLKVIRKYKFGGFIVIKLNKNARKKFLKLPILLNKMLIFMYFKFCDIFDLHDFIGYVLEKKC